MKKSMQMSITAVICASAIALVLAFIPFTSKPAHAEEPDTESTSINAMLALIQDLLDQISALQDQLNTVRGEVRAVLRDGLQEGMTNDDIRRVQELLATDRDIYPEGIVTGYFGPLTRGALMRFQRRHGLEVTGKIDEETRLLLDEYLKERFGDSVPSGLLRAPGIQSKVERRLWNHCTDNRTTDRLCKRLKEKYSDDNASDDDSDSMSNDETDDDSIDDSNDETDNLVDDSDDDSADDSDDDAGDDSDNS